MPKADDGSPFVTEPDRKSHDIMLAERLAGAHFMDQEPSIVIKRWEYEDAGGKIKKT